MIIKWVASDKPCTAAAGGCHPPHHELAYIFSWLCGGFFFLSLSPFLFRGFQILSKTFRSTKYVLSRMFHSGSPCLIPQLENEPISVKLFFHSYFLVFFPKTFRILWLSFSWVAHRSREWNRWCLALKPSSRRSIFPVLMWTNRIFFN